MNNFPVQNLKQNKLLNILYLCHNSFDLKKRFYAVFSFKLMILILYTNNFKF